MTILMEIVIERDAAVNNSSIFKSVVRVFRH